MHKYEISIEGYEAPIKIQTITRNTLKVAMSFISSTKPDYMTAGEIILNSHAGTDPTWNQIKNDQEDVEAYTSATMAAVGIVKPKKSTVRQVGQVPPTEAPAETPETNQ